MSKRFKTVLIVRFFGYFIFLLGLASFFSVFGPIVSAEFNYRKDAILGNKHLVPNIITSNDATGSGQISNNTGSDSFGNISGGEVITPVSTDFGIVIEKINANAKVVANVDPASQAEYTEALGLGVAHAKGTNVPGEKGNIYLFSHSTDAPWNIVRFNAIFYLLRELEPGDRVIMYYNNKRYDYIVYDKNIVDPSDVSYLTNRYDQSVLTLQTCDPPGTLLHRLIIRARLAGS
jgi:LPXTG-site transpeptidase (sortase) family protein